MLGAGCGSGIFYVLRSLNKRPDFRHYVVSTFLAVLGLFGIYFGLYSTTFVTPDNMEVNHSFKGQHISNLFYKSGQRITFDSYLKENFNNRESIVAVRIKGAYVPLRTGDEGQTNSPSWDWFSIVLEGLGFLIGGLAIGPIWLGKETYCEKCRMYMKTKSELYAIDVCQYEENLKDLSYAMFQGNLKNFVLKKKEYWPKSPFYYVDIQYCPLCYDGFIIFRYMAFKSDSSGGSFREVFQYNKTVVLQGYDIKQIEEL